MDSIHDGYLRAYLDDNARFAKTIVIKMAVQATLLNKLIEKDRSYEVDVNYPETWKYYLNLSGQYHPTDKMMTVISIDTLQEIEFTRENLKINSATAEAYRFGTRYYNSLLVRYPDQEMLINGILNPVDIETAINAEDGTILAYDKDLIETNEVTLVQELETWIKSMFFRWYVGQFAVSNPLYPAAFMTQLSLQIILKLLNLRLKRVKTVEAHSFHVRMYLASHSELDRYLPYLTLKQSLWLYRNIAYLERNPGKMKQFMLLIEKILTERGIPIGEYSVRQLSTFGEDGYPETIARIKLLNNPTNTGSIDYHSLETLFGKETDIFPGNADYLAANLSKDLAKFSYANSTVTGTKALRSSMIDYSNATPITFEEVALKTWCYMGMNNMYDVMVSFKDPKTSESYSLFAKDAFIYLYYISLKADGYEVDQIPEYLNIDHRRHPLPSVDDLLEVSLNQEDDLMRVYAEALLEDQPALKPVYSSTSFYDLIYAIYQESYWHWFFVAEVKDMFHKASVKRMIQQLYASDRVDFNVGEPNMDNWLYVRNLPKYDHSRDQAKELIKNIYEAATGIKVDNNKLLRNIQKQLLELVKELSSYSIQFIREINEADVVIVTVEPVCYGNVKGSIEQTDRVETRTQVQDLSGYSEATCLVENTPETSIKSAGSLADINIDIKAVTDTNITSEAVFERTVRLNPLKTVIRYNGQDEALEDKVGLYGLTQLNALDNTLKKEIVLDTF